MLALICSAIAVAAAILTAVGLARSRWLDRIPRAAVAAAVVIGGLGSLLLVSQQRVLDREMRQRQWPTVDGVVVSAEVSHDRALMPQIRFRYRVGDRTFERITDLHTPAFGGKAKRLETAERVISAYPPGRSVLVHYNPADPSVAYLRVGPTWDVYMKVGFGAFLLFLALTVLTTGLLMRRKQSAAG